MSLVLAELGLLALDALIVAAAVGLLLIAMGLPPPMLLGEWAW